VAEFILTNAPAKRHPSGVVSETYHLDGQKPAFPYRTIKAETVKRAMAQLDEYAAEAKVTGASLAVRINLVAGRAPNGWRQLDAGSRVVHVNLVDG
jgi:hypothetical protein